jgi:hypothetical protein
MRQLSSKWFSVWAGIVRYGTKNQCNGLRVGCRVRDVGFLFDIDVTPQRFNSLAEHVRESIGLSFHFNISRKARVCYPLPSTQVLLSRTD